MGIYPAQCRKCGTTYTWFSGHPNLGEASQCPTCLKEKEELSPDEWVKAQLKDYKYVPRRTNMTIHELAKMPELICFKRPHQSEKYYFEQGILWCHQPNQGNTLAKITKNMMMVEDWILDCEHPHEKIEFKNCMDAYLFKCQVCLQEMEPATFRVKASIPEARPGL